jgi:nuclear pore complex protein Nup88
MVLTSDNVLRSFNLDLEQDSPEESLFLSGSADYTNERRFFGQSALSVRGSLGETAVSFSFAPPISNGNDPDPPLWPVFILCGDGSVYFVVLGHKEDKKPRVMGPLPMLPESEDNYGTDACAILTLHPMISSPPIVVIATTKGTLYHCIVLQKCDDSDLDTASQISDWSTSVTGLENVPIDLVLHVYESVELELSLLSDDDKKPFDYPLLLSVDPFTPSRYFCSHKAGVHSVSLPMVAQLAELAQASDESVAKGLVPMEQSSIVQHLICTQLFSGQIGCPMQGLALSFPPARMHCILGDYKAVTVALSKAVKVSEPQPLLCTTTQHDPVKPTKESFEMHIQQMLQRSTCNPLMKSNEIMTSEECYEILARSTKVLREEYISRMEKARSENEKRTAGLKARKSQQIKSVSNLTDERFCLRENAAQLSEKYEDLRDNQDNLVSRIEAVLHAIQRRLPVTSDSEVRMHRQLQNIEKKVKDLSNALEQIKAKERYQMKQIKHSQENIKTRSEVVNQLGQNQAESMKDVLRQDGEQIADVIKRLNGLKKEVAM